MYTSINVDLVLTLYLDTGRANVYERLSPQKLLLVREFSNREEADAYIEHDRKMTEASERVCQDFRTWVAQWVINEAEKIGLEPRLVQFHSHGIPENCQLATNREATVSRPQTFHRHPHPRRREFSDLDGLQVVGRGCHLLFHKSLHY